MPKYRHFPCTERTLESNFNFSPAISQPSPWVGGGAVVTNDWCIVKCGTLVLIVITKHLPLVSAAVQTMRITNEP